MDVDPFLVGGLVFFAVVVGILVGALSWRR